MIKRLSFLLCYVYIPVQIKVFVSLSNFRNSESALPLRKESPSSLTLLNLFNNKRIKVLKILGGFKIQSLTSCKFVAVYSKVLR